LLQGEHEEARFVEKESDEDEEGGDSHNFFS